MSRVRTTTRLADLLRCEHHALSDFLVALATFDRRKLWVELGYNSLFAFLRRELRLFRGRGAVPQDRGGAHPDIPAGRGLASERRPMPLLRRRGRQGDHARELGGGPP